MVIIQIITKKFELESVKNVGAWIPVRVEYGEEAIMQGWTSSGAVNWPLFQKVSLIDTTKASLN